MIVNKLFLIFDSSLIESIQFWNKTRPSVVLYDNVLFFNWIVFICCFNYSILACKRSIVSWVLSNLRSKIKASSRLAASMSYLLIYLMTLMQLLPLLHGSMKSRDALTFYLTSSVPYCVCFFVNASSCSQLLYEVCNASLSSSRSALNFVFSLLKHILS